SKHIIKESDKVKYVALGDSISAGFDARFGDLYHFPNAGAYYHKLLELYKPKYITNLADKLETVEFDKTKIRENLNAIKHHIVNHSTLVTNDE
ncbi:hypothetical protein, partial [Mycoplasmopsis bovis]|uniref:hypothetical protein n=1 Tax=Mycoplasmopsis bovis TaxID=28903 RepID=UPI003D2E7868